MKGDAFGGGLASYLFRNVSPLLLGMILLGIPPSLPGQVPTLDNFERGANVPLDPGWIRYAPGGPLGALPVHTIENGAYRINIPYGFREPLQLLPATGDPTIDALRATRPLAVLGDDVFLARGGSLRIGGRYADYFLATDVLPWNGTEAGNSFGLISRINTPVFLGSCGYFMMYLPRERSLVLGRMMNEIPQLLAITHANLSPTARHRFIARGKGSVLMFDIYDADNLAEPVASVRTSDSYDLLIATSLTASLILPALYQQVEPQVEPTTGDLPLPKGELISGITHPPIGDSGVIVANLDTLGRADASFDNYLSSPDPDLTLVGFPGTPHVTQLVPMPNATHHPASQGMSFVARTYFTNSIADVKLFLNGLDVSTSPAFSKTANTALPDPALPELLALVRALLQPQGETLLGGLPPDVQALDDGLLVRFTGLITNRVYSAMAVLTDSTGRVVTNRWNFDTFVAGETVTIEAEDFNFNGGQYLPNAPLSGQGGWTSTYLGNDAPVVNPFPVGYHGAPAGVYNIDFFDTGEGVRDTYSLSGAQLDGLYNYYAAWDRYTETERSRAYRLNDPIATTQEAGDLPRPGHLAAGVKDYYLWMLRSGEWANYTRDFPASGARYYNVYLRASSVGNTSVALDKVASSRSQPDQILERQGVFNVANTGSQSRYRLIPLLDPFGRMKVVELTGTQTLRMTVLSALNNLQINYLVFVPATNLVVVPPDLIVNQPASGQFEIHIHKARNNATLPNTHQRAEDQLAGTLIDPLTGLPYVNEAAGSTDGRYIEPGLINYEQRGLEAGLISGDKPFPGIPPANYPDNDFGAENIAMSALIFLQMQPGLHRWGVRSDDGFRVTTGPLTSLTNLVLGEFEGGRGDSSTEFEFVIQQPGVYPFRLLYYEGAVLASVEWYEVDPKTGQPIGLNARIPTLNPSHALPQEAGEEPGMIAYVAKARNNAPAAQFPNTWLRTELHLAGLLIDPDGNQPYMNEITGTPEAAVFDIDYVNYEQTGTFTGFFMMDAPFPGVGGANPDNISMAVTTYLDLPVGRHRMGVRSDDGFAVTSGLHLMDTNLVLGAYNNAGGRPGTPTEFEFQVTKAGLYPFRLIYQEGRGGAEVEWYMYTENREKRLLVNDQFSGGVRAFRRVAGPIAPVTLLQPERDGNEVAFYFDSLAGRTYQVEFTPSLTLPDWQEVGGIISGTGARLRVASPNPGFYRVRTNP